MDFRVMQSGLTDFGLDTWERGVQGNAAVAVASVAVVPAVAAVAIGLAVDCVVAVVAMSAVARGALLTEGGGSKRPHSFPKQFRLRNHST